MKSKKKSLELIYIANARMPTEKAHGTQIMKMCEAFTKQGLKVMLIIPNRYQINKSLKNVNPFPYYGIQYPFKIKKLFTLDGLRFDAWMKKVPFPLLYFIQEITFACSVLFHIGMQPQKCILYSRSWVSLIFLLCLRKRHIFFEAHEFPQTQRARRLMKWIAQKVEGIITITENLRRDFISLGIDPQKIRVAPDAVDSIFFKTYSKEKIRKELRIPKTKKIIMYTGNLYPWKGVYTLAKATVFLPKNVTMIFIGGSVVDQNIEPFNEFIQKNHLKNIQILGHKPPLMIPKYLAAADVLVLPNSAKEIISERHTSPLKLFEYMAARRIIVASDLPSIREILNEEFAILVKPDDPQALSEGIQKALESKENQSRIRRAFEKVKSYTWLQRAQQIIQFQEETSAFKHFSKSQ